MPIRSPAAPWAEAGTLPAGPPRLTDAERAWARRAERWITRCGIAAAGILALPAARVLGLPGEVLRPAPPDAFFTLRPDGLFRFALGFALAAFALLATAHRWTPAVLGRRYGVYFWYLAGAYGPGHRAAIRVLGALGLVAAVAVAGLSANAVFHATARGVATSGLGDFRAAHRPWAHLAAVEARADDEPDAAGRFRAPEYALRFADGARWDLANTWIRPPRGETAWALGEIAGRAGVPILGPDGPTTADDLLARIAPAGCAD